MNNPFVSPRGITALRLLFGLLQGLALYALTRALEAKAWPSTNPLIYDPLLNVARYVPIFAIVSVGNLRPKTTAIWIPLLIVLCGGLGFHEGLRDPKVTTTFLYSSSNWLLYGFGIPTLLFVCQSLVAAGDADRRRIASFPTYFDVAWRLATQFILSAVFILLLWGILFLGAALFRAIGIEFFFKTIVKLWFAIPVTAVASSAALHLTDAHTGLVRGARALLLNLLSWLMPLMTGIAVGFVVALPFTGLDPLWKTKFATGSLLGAVTILILLINSHFQDGVSDVENSSRFLTVMRLPAALVLTPLTALATYGLFLRVQQYGWTPDRVIVVALLIVAGCHAVGYAIAGLTSGPALRRLPATNIAGALVGVACILALLTPAADPARISVASQVARLESGAVDPDKFDFNFLRFRSARFGMEALERLKAKKEGPNATRIAEKASRALVTVSPYASTVDRGPQLPATTETRRANITVVPAGAPALPADFIGEDWASYADKNRLLPCLTEATAKCEATIVALMADGSPAIILITPGASWIFAKGPEGKWAPVGTLANAFCTGVRDGLKAGKVELAPPRFKQVEVNGMVLAITPPCAPIKR